MRTGKRSHYFTERHFCFLLRMSMRQSEKEAAKVVRKLDVLIVKGKVSDKNRNVRLWFFVSTFASGDFSK